MALGEQLERDLAQFEKLDDRALEQRIIYGIYKLVPLSPEKAAEYTIQYDSIIKKHKSDIRYRGSL